MTTAYKKAKKAKRKKENEFHGWSNWDTWETALVLESDQEGYKNKQAWKANFERKKKRGTYNQKKAESIVPKYIVPRARKFDSKINKKKVNKKEIVSWILE